VDSDLHSFHKNEPTTAHAVGVTEEDILLFCYLSYGTIFGSNV